MMLDKGSKSQSSAMRRASKSLRARCAWRRGLPIVLAMMMAATSVVVVQAASAPPAEAAAVRYVGRMDYHSFSQGVLPGYDTWYSEGVVLQAPPGKIPQNVANQWMQWYVAHDRIIRQMNFLDFDGVYRTDAHHLGLGRVKVLGFGRPCGGALGCGTKTKAEVHTSFLDQMLADPFNYYHQGQWTMLYEMSRGGPAQNQPYFNRGVWPIETLYEPALMVSLFYNAFDNVGFRNGSAFERMFDNAVLRLDDWETDPAQRTYLQEFSDPFNKKPGEWSSGTIVNGMLFRILQVTDSQTTRQILENLVGKSQVSVGQGANNTMCDFQHAVNEATGYRYASVFVHRWRLPGNCGWNVPPLVGDGGIPGPAANRAPSFTPGQAGQEIRSVVGKGAATRFPASDPDGDALTWSAAPMPPGFGLIANEGVFGGTPTRVGTYDITMTVSDGRGGTDSISFRWIVDPVANGVPSILPVWGGGDLRGTVGEVPPAVEFGSSDPDGDQLSFSATGMPPGLSVNAGTGTITGTFTEPGTYSTVVTVSDGRGGTDSVSFGWIVAPADDGEPPADFACQVVDGVLSWTDQGVDRYFVRQVNGGDDSFLTTVEGTTSLQLPGRADQYLVRARVDGAMVETEPCVGNPGQDPDPDPDAVCTIVDGRLSWVSFNGEDDSYQVRRNGAWRAAVSANNALSYPIDDGAGTWLIRSRENGTTIDHTCTR